MRAPFQLGPWTVDPRVGELTRPGRPAVRLRLRVMDLLVYFAEHPGEVLTKNDLLNGVWHTEAISESALTRTIAELRQALGDEAEQPVFLETIPKRGYRLVAPVAPVPAADPDQSSGSPDSGVASGPADSAMPAPTSRWARPARRRLVALAVLIAAVAIPAALWQVRTMRGAAPARSAAFAPREWVLVTAFENRTGRPEFDGTLEHALEHELSNSTYVNVAPRERIEDALRLMVKPVATRVDATIGREVALRDADIRLVIASGIDRLGGEYAMTVQVIEPRDGTVIASRREEAARESDIAPAMRRLANWIRTSLGESPLHVAETNRQLEKATTPSLRALRLYSEGLAAFNREFRQNPINGHAGYGEARSLLSAAVSEDPDFASARIWLAWAEGNRRTEDATFLRHAQLAADRADRTTDRERYFIMGSYYELSGDKARAAGSYEALTRLYPDHYWGQHNLAGIYGELGRHVEAGAAVLRASVAKPNDFELAARAATELLWAGHLEAARSQAAKARALLQATPWHHEATGTTGLLADFVRRFPVHDHWAQRQIREALDSLETEPGSMSGDSPADASLYQVGSFYQTLGQFRRASDVWSRIQQPDLRRQALGALEFARAQPGAARRYLSGYTGRDPINIVLLVRSGDVDGAKRMLDSPAFRENIHRRALAAEIAFASSRRNDSTVVNDLTSVVSTIHRAGARRHLHAETLADVFVARGETDAAIRVLLDARAGVNEAYNTLAHTGYYWLRAQLKLADLYRANGMADRARPIEAHLLAALSHADADHPMLLELKKRN